MGLTGSKKNTIVIMSQPDKNAVANYAENMENITASEDEQPKPVVDRQKEVEVELQELDDGKNDRALFRTRRQLTHPSIISDGC